MSHHARLVLRNGVYYHRAAVPRELWSTFGKREELKSLRTKDKNVAVQRLRMAAVDFDQRIAKHRERLANQVDALTDDQIQAIADIYHAHLLEEDEDERLRGLRDEEHQSIVIRPRPEYMTAASCAEAMSQIVGADLFCRRGPRSFHLWRKRRLRSSSSP